MELINATKKSWRYIKNYKGYIAITIVAMFIVQLLNMLSPLIIKTLIDDQIFSITKPFYKVDKPSENTVNYKDNYYSQEKYIKETTLPKEGISIVYHGKNFYIVNDIIEKGNRVVEENTLRVVGINKDYELEKLSPNELKQFYKPSIKAIIILVLLLLIRPLLSAFFGYIQRISSAFVIANMTKDGREDAAECIHKMPIHYFEEEPVGKTANRITHDISGITMMFDKILNLGFSASFSFILAYYFMFKLDVTLALISLMLIPVYVLWANFFTKKLNSYATKINELSSLITAKLNENINGINIIKMFNYQKGAIDTFNETNSEFMKESMKEVKLHLTLGWNMISMLKGLSTAAIIAYFGYRQLLSPEAVVTAGVIYAYNDYIGRIITPLFMLFRELGNIEHAIVKTNRFFTIIDSEKEDSSFQKTHKYNGKIEFKNLWFGYSERYVLKGIDLTIEPGTMCGIVGHTGSGKSTLMNLLMRFYDLKKNDIGQILVDNFNILEYSKRTYRQHIGIILQEPVLFRGTIASNIRYGNDKLSDQEVTDIIEKIGGSDLLKKFSDGINQRIVRGGENLSLGERQLISFGRVLAANPSILIMDEATANIDTGTEMMIQKALNVVSKDRTVIVIAHRLSTIKNADKIVVLASGEKIEEGNHESLLKNNKTYASMYRAQSN